MAQVSGLNVRLYVMGYDLSGDANALDSAGYSQALLDTTPLNTTAMTRITGLADSSLGVNGYFDNASNKIHDVFTSNSGKLPTADQLVLVPFGSAVGDPCFGIVAKEAEYNVSRSSGTAMTVSSSFSHNATGNTSAGGEFGEMMTAHDDTHSSAGSGTEVDSGASSSNGAVGILQLLSLASGSVVVNLQESTSSGGSFSNFMTFSTVAAAGAPTSERLEMSGTVQRYLKLTTTGTFSKAKIAVGLFRL